MKLIRVSLMLAILPILVFLSPYRNVLATINGYLGSGYFPTNNLNWCHIGTKYASESQNAVARWSVDTDLNMYTNCSSSQIQTKYLNYGNTGWAGYGYICNTSNQCDNSSAFNGTYKNCEARLNGYAISGNPSFYTSAEVQKLATHELGHCYSLDHANVSGSVMNGGSVPNTQDISLVNARY